MSDTQKLYYQRAIIPALISSALLVTIGIMTKKSTAGIVFMGILGLPAGYIIGNAGKW